MSKSKHTPGPWKACLNVPTAAIPGHIVKADHGSESPVASLWKGGGTHGVEQQIANAHLIAAGPDLLDACVEALDRLRHVASVEPQLNGYGARRETIQQLTAAIAKAKGQS